MDEWRWPSRQDLIKNGLPTYGEMFWGSALKWVLLIYFLVALGFYRLYVFTENNKVKNGSPKDSLKIEKIQNNNSNK
jgi:hypothetical protein